MGDEPNVVGLVFSRLTSFTFNIIDSIQIETSKLKELRVVKRRCRVQQDLLRDHLDVCLVTLYELGSYQLYLTAAPACSSCLLLKQSTEVPDLADVQAKVLQALEFEWATVLSMEQNKNTADLLHRLCPHVRWQVYRETMVCLETDAFKVTQNVRDLVMAWYPRLSFSANIEDQFAAMQDNVRRGSKGGAAGITNLNTVGVKALYAKMLDGDGQATSVKLQDTDWEGTTVRALKQKLFQPESFTGRATPANSISPPDIFVHEFRQPKSRDSCTCVDLCFFSLHSSIQTQLKSSAGSY